MRTSEIAEFLSAELIGDGNQEISSVADVDSAAADQIAFTTDTSKTQSMAGCLLVPMTFEGPPDSPFIRVQDPKLAFSRVAELLHPARQRDPEIHPSVVIAGSAVLGKDVFIGAFVCVGGGSIIGDGTQLRAGTKIGNGVTIGSRCVIGPNAFVEDGCTVGDGVVLHAGVVIGADGFGYVRDSDRYVKFPQIGTVVIESDVEIGANSCVDRGALGETRIGQGTKIDNLVQVAHNVQIGKRVIIAAQTGISGSTVIEDDCVIGGQVGMGDHARVQSGAVIGSQAGVLPGKIVRPGVWWGTPVQRLDEYKRQNAHVKSLGRLKDEVKSLRERMADKD